MRLAELVETRSGMRMFLRAVREGWPMDTADRDAAFARLAEIGRQDRGRTSYRARETLAKTQALLAHQPGGASTCGTNWGR